MEFRVTRTDDYRQPKMSEAYPALKKYDFKDIFVRDKYGDRWEGLLKIDSIEDLVTISKDIDEMLIVYSSDPLPTLEIYDDYRE